MRHPCLIPPARSAASSHDTTDFCCGTVYDSDAFATILIEDPSQAATLLARLTSAQRICQALAHVRRCHALGQPSTLDAVLADWQQRVTGQADTDDSLPPIEPPLPITTLAFQLAANPLDVAILLAALPLTQRVAAAHEHAAWLSRHGLPRTVDEVLRDWHSMVSGDRRFGDGGAQDG